MACPSRRLTNPDAHKESWEMGTSNMERGSPLHGGNTLTFLRAASVQFRRLCGDTGHNEV